MSYTRHPLRALAFLSLAATLFAAESVAPLVDAIKAKDRATALKLLAAKADVNAALADGSTALLWAVYNDDAEMVAQLIKAGADAKLGDGFGSTPLSAAAAAGNVDVIASLLEAGADANEQNADGWTALMSAARKGNVKAARLLIEKGADVNRRERLREQTALLWAAAESQPEIVRELLAHKADPDARGEIVDLQSRFSGETRAKYRPPGGLTPLLYAAQDGWMECAKALVESGADINLSSTDNVSPLLLAVLNGNVDLAAFLTSKDAKVSQGDRWGRTPLYAAVGLNAVPRSDHPGGADGEKTSLDVIGALLDKGANPNAQLKLPPPFAGAGADRGAEAAVTMGATPLLFAAGALDAAATKLLLAKGALPNLPNARGITPIMAAAGLSSGDDERGIVAGEDVQKRSVATLELLLAAGGDVNAADPRGRTALHGAASRGWNDVVQFLVDHKANLNAKDAKGMTPAHSANPDTAALPQKLMGATNRQTAGTLGK